MQGLEKTRILFIAGFGPIVRDRDASRKLYAEALDIPFKEESGGYLHTNALQGAKEFALWPLSQAAESCFGTSTWPDTSPAPHAWLEFDVDTVEKATAELESTGYTMLIENKKEPWGQTVSRFFANIAQSTDCFLDAVKVKRAMPCFSPWTQNMFVAPTSSTTSSWVYSGTCF